MLVGQSISRSDGTIYGTMAEWLGYWTTNPEVLGSKPPGGSKINPTFDPSEIEQMSARNL